MQISLLITGTKARNICKILKAREGEKLTELFIANHGQFQRFRQLFNLHNGRISGEAASADIEAAKEFVDQLDGVITKHSYYPEQIFDMNKTWLWSYMQRSYMQNEAKLMPGSKASVFEDRVMLLLGRNFAGLKSFPDLQFRKTPCFKECQ